MVRSICAILAALWSVPTAAQNYPSRPIRFVVPLAPAGAGDIVARTVAAKLSELWGQQIVIDNRPGANTIIGTDLVAKSKPDGYTWLLGVQGSLAINPATYPSLPYDPEKDFDAVTQMTVYGYVLVVHPALPVKSVAELIALARSRPGELAYGTSGNGGSNHLAGESFRLASGIRLNAIPYKGSAPALTALLAGDVPLMFDTLITSIPLLKAGLALSAVIPIALATDTFSIVTMEIIENATMLLVPGAMAAYLDDPLFWLTMAAGFAIAFPFAFLVNRALLRRGKGHALVHEYH